MKTMIASALVVSLLLFTAHTASAQPESAVGIGVGLSGAPISSLSSEFDFSPFTTFNVPVYVSPMVLIDPELGFARAVSNGDNVDVKVTSVELGTGLFGAGEVGSETRFYAGLRLGVTFNQTKSDIGDSSNEDNRNDFFVGPAIGGEHFFGDHFSLGAETRLLVLFYGSTGEGDTTDNRITATNGVFFIRVYL